MITEPRIENRPAQYYAAIRTAVPIPFGSYLPPLWEEVVKWLAGHGVTDFGPTIIRYLTTDMSQKLDIDVGFIIDRPITGDARVIVDSLPAGRYAVLSYTGPYEGDGVYLANVKMVEWAKANHIAWDTSDRKGVEWWNGRVEIYLTDPDVEPDPQKYETELAFLVK
jgi:effector-binding domain-containing protein